MPREGHDPPIIGWVTDTTHFNPRAPRGARPCGWLICRNLKDFNPRAPRGARPSPASRPDGRASYFNPRAPRGARRDWTDSKAKRRKISIHVPREGHDHALLLQGQALFISIHVPREGHDDACAAQAARDYYFNPRAPRGARLQILCVAVHCSLISIHVPREGHDAQELINGAGQAKFQSTCPARGTTARRLLYDYSCQNFNPRAPRGARRLCVAVLAVQNHFNPRAPRGARRAVSQQERGLPQAFQSTCPARGTTGRGRGRKARVAISIHVPREGHDDAMR